MSDKRKNGPQNRAKNRPAFENSFSAVTGGSVPSRISDADERKTVILDNELEGLEFEDKVWLFWRRNKNVIIAVVAAIFISAADTRVWWTAGPARCMSTIPLLGILSSIPFSATPI